MPIRFTGVAPTIGAVVPFVLLSAGVGDGPIFTDATSEAGLQSTHAPSLMMKAGANIIANLCSGGVAGDFDNDGDQDVFVVVGGAAPDALYLNDGTGHFTDEAAAWGVDVMHMGMAAAVGDYDGDGWLDIFVTSGGPEGTLPLPGQHRLYRNTGGDGFEEVAAAAGVDTGSPFLCDGLGATFCDYDVDGDLDLYIAGWIAVSQGNRLFRNEGDGTFTDVTIESGLGLSGVNGFSPRFVDMNGDRRPELLLAADYGTSRYFANLGDGTFVDLTETSGTGLDDNGMGSIVADLDGDGVLDWYVTSIFSAAKQGIPGTGNMLYRGFGEHVFDEIATAAGVEDGNWAWGTDAVDLDHDGRLDLLCTNGWIHPAQYQDQPARVWHAQPDGTFEDVAASSGLWHTLSGRGLLTADFDADGDRDVMIFSNRDQLRYFRNEAPSSASRAWLRLSFDTSGGRRLAPRGVGTQVVARHGSTSLIAVLDGGTNYQAQSELAVHLGLGAIQVLDELRIEWADGTVTLLRDLPTRQHLTIVSGERCDLDGSGTVDAADLGIVLAEWGDVDPTEPVDLDGDGTVGPADLALVLANWWDGTAP